MQSKRWLNLVFKTTAFTKQWVRQVKLVAPPETEPTSRRSQLQESRRLWIWFQTQKKNNIPPWARTKVSEEGSSKLKVNNRHLALVLTKTILQRLTRFVSNFHQLGLNLIKDNHLWMVVSLAMQLKIQLARVSWHRSWAGTYRRLANLNSQQWMELYPKRHRTSP